MPFNGFFNLSAFKLLFTSSLLSFTPKIYIYNSFVRCVCLNVCLLWVRLASKPPYIYEFATRKWIASRHQIKSVWCCKLDVWTAYFVCTSIFTTNFSFSFALFDPISFDSIWMQVQIILILTLIGMFFESMSTLLTNYIHLKNLNHSLYSYMQPHYNKLCTFTFA